MREQKRIGFKFADDAPEGIVKGYGSVFGNIDSHGDVIEKGAFKETLREWETQGKYPPMLLQHGGGMFGGDSMSGVPIGVWTSMEENAKGLKVEGELLAMDTDDIKRVYAAMKRQALDGLSIGYDVKESISGTKPGEPRRRLTAIDLWELSVVTFPSNDRARVGSVKAAEIRTIRDFESFLRDAGFSHSQAKSIAARGFRVAEQEQPDLSDLLRTIRDVRSGVGG